VNLTRNVQGQYFPVIIKVSVPGTAAMPLRTSAFASSDAASSPDASTTPSTFPVTGSIRTIWSVGQTLAQTLPPTHSSSLMPWSGRPARVTGTDARGWNVWGSRKVS
jgi:hypothetical protein